jgi:hypothetical protein
MKRYKKVYLNTIAWVKKRIENPNINFFYDLPIRCYINTEKELYLELITDEEINTAYDIYAEMIGKAIIEGKKEGIDEENAESEVYF